MTFLRDWTVPMATTMKLTMQNECKRIYERNEASCMSKYVKYVGEVLSKRCFKRTETRSTCVHFLNITSPMFYLESRGWCNTHKGNRIKP